jgi:cytochrome P450
MTESIKVDVASLPLPPGRSGLPLLGETLEFVQSPIGFINKRRAQYGDVFRTSILGDDTVIVGTPDANRWVFSGENKYLTSKWNKAISLLLGAEGVAMLTGEAHAKRRTQLAPHFKHDAMSEFVASIQKITEQRLAEWADIGGETSVVDRIRTMAFEIISVFIFGDTKVDVPYLSNLFQKWTGGMFDPLPMELPFTPFGKAMRAKREMHDYLAPIVAGRMKLKEQPFDILGSMLSVRDENGEGLSLEAILDEVQVQLFAGHDTTVTALTNIMMLLAQHPDVLQRARDEQKSCEHLKVIDLEAIKSMPYLEQVINEGLRFIPPINGAFRMTTEDTAYGGYRIPKGWTILFSITLTHRLEPWNNPLQFDPDRFTAERAEHKQKQFSYVPFGGGPRMCLGRNFALVEMSIILALLLRGYKWTLVPNQDLSLMPLPFPLPKSGVRVKFGAL